MRGVRPLEWALLAFVAFAVSRGGWRIILEWRDLGAAALLGLALVGTAYLVRKLRRLPWPVGTVAMRRLLKTTLPLAGAPIALAAVLTLGARGLRDQVMAAHPSEAVSMIATAALFVLGAGLPLLVLWLALAIHVKEQGELDLLRFAGEASGDLARTLREWLPLTLALASYALMTEVVGDFESRDAWMQAADRALFFGADPLDLVQAAIWAPLSEWLAFAYSFYILMFPLVLGAVFMFGGRRGVREVSFLIGAAMLLSYVSYALIPVQGPLLTRQFDVSLQLYLVAPIKEAMMDRTRVVFDCFPSMHTCCTVLMAWSAWRYARRLFWVLLPIVASIPLACVYLRYHYVIDVLAGFAFAAVMIRLTIRLRPVLWRDLPEPPPVT